MTPLARDEAREGMVMAYDYTWIYVGCIGEETWRWLLDHPELDHVALARIVGQARAAEEARRHALEVTRFCDSQTAKLDEALRSLTTVVKEDAVVVKRVRERAESAEVRAAQTREALDDAHQAAIRFEGQARDYETALREIVLHDGGGEYGDRCQHRMAGRKHSNCRPLITEAARVALAGAGVTDNERTVWVASESRSGGPDYAVVGVFSSREAALAQLGGAIHPGAGRLESHGGVGWTLPGGGRAWEVSEDGSLTTGDAIVEPWRCAFGEPAGERTADSSAGEAAARTAPVDSPEEAVTLSGPSGLDASPAPAERTVGTGPTAAEHAAVVRKGFALTCSAQESTDGFAALAALVALADRYEKALERLENATRILDVMLREPAAEGLMSAEDYRGYVQGAWLGVDEAAKAARAVLAGGAGDE